MTLTPLDGCGPTDPALVYVVGLCTVITLLLLAYIGWRDKKDREKEATRHP